MRRRAARARYFRPDSDSHDRSSAFTVSNARATPKSDACGHYRPATPFTVSDA